MSTYQMDLLIFTAPLLTLLIFLRIVDIDWTPAGLLHLIDCPCLIVYAVFSIQSVFQEHVLN